MDSKWKNMVTASVCISVECGDGTFQAAFVSFIVLLPSSHRRADVSTYFFHLFKCEAFNATNRSEQK